MHCDVCYINVRAYYEVAAFRNRCVKMSESRRLIYDERKATLAKLPKRSGILWQDLGTRKRMSRINETENRNRKQMREAMFSVAKVLALGRVDLR